MPFSRNPLTPGAANPVIPSARGRRKLPPTEGGTSIPKGSTLIGHVSEAHAATEGQAGSSMGIVFDKAGTREGREIPLSNVGIRALAAAEASALGGVEDTGTLGGAGGGAGASRSGGGLLGRTPGS